MFKLTQWHTAQYGDAALRETSGELAITLGDVPATRVYDAESKTVRDVIRVSLYPLAAWIAASWWRLRWEPAASSAPPPPSWRMAHEIPAAGYGYTWPQITIIPDGEAIDTQLRASRQDHIGRISYLAEPVSERIDFADFDREIDAFMSLVLGRLRDTGHGDQPVSELWEDVLSERGDQQASEYRRFEAQAGFDPTEAPIELVEFVIEFAKVYGDAVASELAPLCTAAPGRDVAQLVQEARAAPAVTAEMALDGYDDSSKNRVEQPWQRGCRLARHVRQRNHLDQGLLSNEELAGLLGMNASALETVTRVGAPPLGLGERCCSGSNWNLHFQKWRDTQRRFEAARFLGDALLTDGLLLPVTDYRTARQKFQRAFAAELLAPIEKIREFQKGYSSFDWLDEAAYHFEVSSWVIEHQLRNQPFEE